MKTFILILALKFSYHAVSVTSAEFNSREKCEYAGEAFVAQHKKEFGEGYYLCVEK